MNEGLGIIGAHIPKLFHLPTAKLEGLLASRIGTEAKSFIEPPSAMVFCENPERG